MITRRTLALTLFAVVSWLVLDTAMWLIILQPSTIDGGDLLALIITGGFLALIRKFVSYGEVKDN